MLRNTMNCETGCMTSERVNIWPLQNATWTHVSLLLEWWPLWNRICISHLSPLSLEAYVEELGQHSALTMFQPSSSSKTISTYAHSIFSSTWWNVSGMGTQETMDIMQIDILPFLTCARVKLHNSPYAVHIEKYAYKPFTFIVLLARISLLAYFKKFKQLY